MTDPDLQSMASAAGLTRVRGDLKIGTKALAAVPVGIADVRGGLGLELRRHTRELGLPRRAVDDALMAVPEVALATERAVDSAADPRAERVHLSPHGHADETSGAPTSGVPSVAPRRRFPTHGLSGEANPGVWS